MEKKTLALGFACLVLGAVTYPLLSAATQQNPQRQRRDSMAEWAYYGHDPGGQHFSPLTKITPANISSFKIAWTYRTGDAYQPKNSRPTAFEATPLYADEILYLGTPLGRVIALDPVTGKERWSYDPHIPKDAGYGDYANRGVSTWKAQDGPGEFSSSPSTLV